MIAGEKLHRPSDAVVQDVAVVVDRRRTVNDPGDPAGSGNGQAGNRFTSESVYALGGGAVLLILALLLYTLATRIGAGGLTVYGEQFVGLTLAGALGTFIGREFAFTPR